MFYAGPRDMFSIVFFTFAFEDEKHFQSLFFAFIAAVTFPHAIVMLKMFSNKNI